MSDFGSQITYKQLLQRHGRIQIPMIQRDYAQGRPSEAEVREEFLNALETALRSPADDDSLPLNLDFIYGSVEGKPKTRFSPLDGQQRLTTLFLLHWYLAWRDERWSEFCELFQAKEKSRFSYSVRPTSEDFFDALVSYKPECRADEITRLSTLITNQSWYFRNWRLDPTVQSTLAMLDAIHTRFATSEGLFERLINDNQPAITFQLLDLNNFGLSDDLYIKMNARGKPLTPFETFKARYEQELGRQFAEEFRSIDGQELTVADFVARRMDTSWAELFWVHRDRRTNLYDGAIMNLFRAVALVTRDPESKAYVDDISSLRSNSRPPSYADFHSKGWLDRDFTVTLIALLETWSKEGGSFSAQLPNSQFFDEKSIFSKLAANFASLSSVEIIQFAAYASFVREHEKSIDPQVFQEWMRIVFNLTVNTDYNRADDLQRSVAGLKALRPHSGEILEHFAMSEKPTGGFSSQQIVEEAVKANLILSHPGWKSRVLAAEQHGYFRGQIDFLLDFSGVSSQFEKANPKNCEENLNIGFQASFDDYLAKAKLMFDQNGIIFIRAELWRRALLVIGNFLLPIGRNYSFLTNPIANGDSWKRLLRNQTQRRQYLKALWDHIHLNAPVEPQLHSIIKNAANLEPWRIAVSKHPEVIDYCSENEIRWEENSTEIYLLKRRQMNGTHTELFSYALYLDLQSEMIRKSLEPLNVDCYESVKGTEFQPCIRLSLSCNKGQVCFALFSFKSYFVIHVDQVELTALSQIKVVLRDECGFAEEDTLLKRFCTRDEIFDVLQHMASHFKKVSSECL